MLNKCSQNTIYLLILINTDFFYIILMTGAIFINLSDINFYLPNN